MQIQLYKLYEKQYLCVYGWLPFVEEKGNDNNNNKHQC